MNNLQVFENSEFGQVRTVLIDNEPYFVGNDVANILGYAEPRSTVSKKVDAEDRGVAKIETPSGTQEMTVVNESGLYSLILGSKLESAKKFKRWVTSEVLPSIRKNGGYIANQENMTPEQIVANALIVAQKIIEDKDKLIEVMKPKAEFFDAVANSKTAVSMNDVAKVLGIKGYGRNNLFEFLRSIKILDSYNRPYQKYVDCGWFRVIEQRYTKNGEGIVTFKTLVYQRGIDAIRRKIIEHQASA